MTGVCLSYARTLRLACRGALFAGVLVLNAGCGAPVISPEESMPLSEHRYRRFSGGPARIYDAAKKTLDEMGVLITGERPGEALHGKMDIARQPVMLYLKIARGNRVYLTFYNLDKEKADKWRTKVYDAIETTLGGAPSERQRGSRHGRRG